MFPYTKHKKYKLFDPKMFDGENRKSIKRDGNSTTREIMWKSLDQNPKKRFFASIEHKKKK